MDLISFGATDIGRKRPSNEDAFFRDDEIGLYVVADGMGGHAAGEVASSEAIDALVSMIASQRQLLDEFKRGSIEASVGLSRLGRILESAIQNAAYLVHGMAQIDSQKSGMGTTISALLVVGGQGITGQVGDSRVYTIRDRRAVQLTQDHTLVNLQLSDGLITPEQAASAKHRHVVTRAVGSRDYVQVDTHAFPVLSGDQFMLCSDGLHAYLTLDDITAACAEDPETAARTLVMLALDRGGKDNITSIVVQVQ